jgi:hypothetical protein
MWIDARNGLTVIDFILEGTSAELDGNVITLEKHEAEKIKQALKNNNLDTEYVIKERDHGKIIDYYADVYIHEDGYVGESLWDFGLDAEDDNAGNKVEAYI